MFRLSYGCVCELRNGPCEEDGSYFLDRDGLQFLFIMTLVAAQLYQRKTAFICSNVNLFGVAMKGHVWWIRICN